MGDEKKITEIQLHNIKTIRKYRLDLSISVRELSYGINKSEGYIGAKESNNGDSYYSDSIMTEIAIFLTKEAETYQAELLKNGDTRKIKTKFTILDFYPQTPLKDEKVIRYLDPIPNDSGPTGTLNAVIENSNFFASAKTLAQTVIHCNEIQGQNWENSDFTNPLDRAVKKGRLKIETLDGGLNGYYKPEDSK